MNRHGLPVVEGLRAAHGDAISGLQRAADRDLFAARFTYFDSDAFPPWHRR